MQRDIISPEGTILIEGCIYYAGSTKDNTQQIPEGKVLTEPV